MGKKNIDDKTIDEIIEDSEPEELEKRDKKIRNAYDELRQAGFKHSSHVQSTLKKKMRKIDTKRQEISKGEQ